MSISWVGGGLIGAGVAVASAIFTWGVRWSMSLFSQRIEKKVSPIHKKLSTLNANMQRALDRQDRQGEKLEKNRDKINELVDEKVAWDECRDVREEREKE